MTHETMTCTTSRTLVLEPDSSQCDDHTPTRITLLGMDIRIPVLSSPRLHSPQLHPNYIECLSTLEHSYRLRLYVVVSWGRAKRAFPYCLAFILLSCMHLSLLVLGRCSIFALSLEAFCCYIPGRDIASDRQAWCICR